jgi:hypothetical protein
MLLWPRNETLRELYCHPNKHEAFSFYTVGTTAEQDMLTKVPAPQRRRLAYHKADVSAKKKSCAKYLCKGTNIYTTVVGLTKHRLFYTKTITTLIVVVAAAAAAAAVAVVVVVVVVVVVAAVVEWWWQW